MTSLITDILLEERIKAERRANGSDRYDEVWEGVYTMAPMPNDEHQALVVRLAAALQEVVGWPEFGEVRAGVNVSDRADDWTQNYRVPDIAVFLRGGRAKNHGTHWQGGPDFVIEIVSEGDQTREKLPFYGEIGVRELLLIDRDPWRLEFFRLDDQELKLAEHSDAKQSTVLESQVVPLSFQLVAGDPRPRIEVTACDSEKRWMV